MGRTLSCWRGQVHVQAAICTIPPLTPLSTREKKRGRMGSAFPILLSAPGDGWGVPAVREPSQLQFLLSGGRLL